MENETHASCYPECGKWLAQRLASSVSPASMQPGLYDVAVWRSWPARELPLFAEQVPASSPFQAIEEVMRARRMRVAPHASACPSGGQCFQVYRAFGIELSRVAHKEVQP